MATNIVKHETVGHASIRAGLLTLLAERPFSGYEAISEIARRTEGALRLPISTVFPLFDALSAEGLARLSEVDHGGRRERPYELTSAGHQYVAEHGDELVPSWLPAPGLGAEEPDSAPAPAPVQAATAGESAPVPPPAPPTVERNEVTQLKTGEDAEAQLHGVLTRLTTAVNQVVEVGSEAQLERATRLVTEAKRGLYRILAEDDEAADT